MNNEHIVLSYIQVQNILTARRADKATAVVSLDLGLTTTEVALEQQGVRFPDGQTLTWSDLEKIKASERGCFVIEDSAPSKIQFFSEEMNCLYSLMPTESAPTMLMSGIPMHRIKGTDPRRDTLEKIKAIAPITGTVLDTATGLGYTAIEAAKTAERVITVEIEPSALEVARLNPWSQVLFDNPKITQIVGDVFDEIEQFEDGAFTRIIHDPPAFNLAGDLYSGLFYRQLCRVLQRGGRLLHYIGDLESKSGRTVSKGATRRLQEAGFSRITRRPQAFGLVAHK
ncbi:MAG: methyltransferase domain-containing protein [Chloroflexi bacterium]|nr:methyltransferase domain-containing protein [Chloroflexota bacterium]